MEYSFRDRRQLARVLKAFAFVNSTNKKDSDYVGIRYTGFPHDDGIYYEIVIKIRINGKFKSRLRTSSNFISWEKLVTGMVALGASVESADYDGDRGALHGYFLGMSSRITLDSEQEEQDRYEEFLGAHGQPIDVIEF